MKKRTIKQSYVKAKRGAAHPRLGHEAKPCAHPTGQHGRKSVTEEKKNSHFNAVSKYKGSINERIKISTRKHHRTKTGLSW